MTYLGLNLIFFIPVAFVASAALTRSREKAPSARTVCIAVLILLLDTAVFDNLMIAVGLFAYNPDLILGIQIFLAPIEDFAYPIAACALLPSIWALIPERRVRTQAIRAGRE